MQITELVLTLLTCESPPLTPRDEPDMPFGPKGVVRPTPMAAARRSNAVVKWPRGRGGMHQACLPSGRGRQITSRASCTSRSSSPTSSSSSTSVWCNAFLHQATSAQAEHVPRLAQMNLLKSVRNFVRDFGLQCCVVRICNHVRARSSPSHGCMTIDIAQVSNAAAAPASSMAMSVLAQIICCLVRP